MGCVNSEQGSPLRSTATPVWDLVIADIRARRDRLERHDPVMDAAIVEGHERHMIGVDRYGVALTPDNGRDHLVDAVEEMMDAAVYIRAEVERSNAPANDLRIKQLYDSSLWLWLQLRAMLFQRDGR